MLLTIKAARILRVSTFMRNIRTHILLCLCEFIKIQNVLHRRILLCYLIEDRFASIHVISMSVYLDIFVAQDDKRILRTLRLFIVAVEATPDFPLHHSGLRKLI